MFGRIFSLAAASAASAGSVAPAPADAAVRIGTGAVKSKPVGKVLPGYWENWDGAGVRPGLGRLPITDSRVPAHGHNVINVINAAFLVIRSEGTARWENGMDSGVKVATPAETRQAEAAGVTILMSIGGAAAGIDLSHHACSLRQAGSRPARACGTGGGGADSPAMEVVNEFLPAELEAEDEDGEDGEDGFEDQAPRWQPPPPRPVQPPPRSRLSRVVPGEARAVRRAHQE